ncbi:hypothetical protein BKA66DRAFT_440994 [Pyrenochaeta sp. MPI-SDFR-AT-0127]|nr:hypothetical protein BKA66DRAFT_440994 [Pyrenochaeta sp. MPI-SDFR-AT-0127]
MVVREHWLSSAYGAGRFVAVDLSAAAFTSTPTVAPPAPFGYAVADCLAVVARVPRCSGRCGASRLVGAGAPILLAELSGHHRRWLQFDQVVSYLPSAVACAVSQCEADDWAIELVLGPLQLYCAAIECPIPDDVMEDAYAAATQTAKQPTQTKPPTQPSAPKQSDHKSTKGSDSEQDLTSTIRTTITRTTTDSSGNTLQVIVPVVMGPTGISTGKPITSTVDGEASSTRPSASTAASLSTTTGASGPALTQGPTSTSAGGSQATGRPANGNGSPFENMQAGAGRWVVSAPLLGLGVTAVLFWSWEL